MTDLDKYVERYTLLKAGTDPERMENFYAKCMMLPIAYLEEALSRHKEEMRDLENNKIPELMFQENRRSIETMNGTTITVKGEINASLKESDMGVVLEWLNAHGRGSIVKQRHYLDDMEVSPDMIEKLKEEGVVLHADLSVNTNSFKKAVKDIYKETDELPPPEVAAVTIFNHAVIKKDKEENEE